ncbi:MAG: TVP38/TMEM64 family protein [Ruminococcaceae bacterium]|nr:TVP38/TMEM64 family protein [Oscillospiraceae bacterium]
MKKEPDRLNSHSKFWIAVTVLFFILLVAITAVSMPFFSRLSDPATQQKLQLLVESMGFSGFFLVLGIQIIQVIIAFIPGEPVELLAGVLYGAWGGLFLCLLGIVLTSSAIFFTVRRFGYPLVLRLFGKEKIRDFKFLNNTEKVEIVTFILFLIPGTPKDMLTYLAGISGIKPSRFLLLSAFARIPSIVTSTTMGATMSHGNWKMTLLIFLLTAGTGLLGILYKDKIISHLHRQHKKPKKSDA